MPLDALEVLEIRNDQLITGDDNMEGSILGVKVLLVPELAQHLTILSVAPVWHDLWFYNTGEA